METLIPRRCPDCDGEGFTYSDLWCDCRECETCDGFGEITDGNEASLDTDEVQEETLDYGLR